MLVEQISVFLENKSGRLAEVTRTLHERNIDIRALYIADTTEYGILRMIVDRPAEAVKALSEKGFTVSSTNVLAIALEDTPGTLDKALAILSDGGISVEYLYAFVGRASTDAVVVIRVEDPARATAEFEKGGIRMMTSREVYGI